MTYLLDTNIVSLLVREDAIVLRKLLDMSPSDSVLIPVIVVGEVLFGIQRLPPGQRRVELQAKLDGLLGGIVLQDLPAGAAAA